MTDGYDYTDCPYCGSHIWGDPGNTDSGLRKHMDNCDARPDSPDAA